MAGLGGSFAILLAATVGDWDEYLFLAKIGNLDTCVALTTIDNQPHDTIWVEAHACQARTRTEVRQTAPPVIGRETMSSSALGRL